ncbi:AAA domain-containing protein [Taklimakanibacter deserti]|uniref:AAA domain-containing protein n=1 Tax=Taklimakanibacter deserti TaxID=2267839 RepID=UPI000E655905
MACRVRYLSSAGIHLREIPGIDALAQAYPEPWLLYTSLQCFPRNEPPIEIDAMVVMDDRVLLLEIKDWNGTLTHNGDQWLIDGRRRGRSAVDSVSMKARKVKTFLSGVIPGFSKYYVDSRVVLTGSATKNGLSPTEQPHVWTLGDAVSISTPAGKLGLLGSRTLHVKKAFQFESELERVTRNAKLFGPLEATWDGFRVVEEDVVVHPRRIWREHRSERIRDTRYKALLRVWSFDKLPPGLNSPDRRRFVAERELRAIGRLNDLGSSLVRQGAVLLPVGEDKDEILTQHFELRGLPPGLGWMTLDRYMARTEDELRIDDRTLVVSTLLGAVGELHARDIAHRDLGARSIWIGSPTRIALTGLMSCQMPDESSIGDWASTLRGYADPTPEDNDPSLAAGGKHRDVFALGRLAFEVLSGRLLDPNELIPEGIESVLPGIGQWIARATERAANQRFANAREMADEFTVLVEQSERKGVNDTLIDRHQTTDNPYVSYAIVQNLYQSGRNHIFVTRNAEGIELVVKIWLGLQRGTSTAVDMALTRLFEGINRLMQIPTAVAPEYVRSALSPVGPFAVYRHEVGTTLGMIPPEEWADRLAAGDVLRFILKFVEGVGILHAIGCSHGDIAPKNILVRDDVGTPCLLDLFDMIEVGSGSIRTPNLCPEGWEGLTEQQLDRYATLRVVELILDRVKDSRLANVLQVVGQELTRPAIETFDPLLRCLRAVELRFHGPKAPHVKLQFPGGSSDFLRSDNGIYYLRAQAPWPGVVEYSISGVERTLAFGVDGIRITYVRHVRATFSSLTHASQHGVPIRLDLSIAAGPEAGFEDLFTVIAPLVDPPGVQATEVTAARRLDIARYWRKLLDLEQSLQPQVKVLRDLSPSNGSFTAYAYERIGLDFDFDAGTTVEVRLPSGKKIGEVNLEQTDSKTLIIEHFDRRLVAGDIVNLVDRKSRTSLDRRTKAVEKILDGEAAIERLVDYFTPDKSLQVTDFGIDVADDVIARYRLNHGQGSAFKHIVRYGPVGYLQGPPGTGKTHFIASLVHWLVADQGARRILIASQSHEAVNNAIEALLNLIKQLGGRAPSLLRIGSKGITDKIRPFHTKSLQERYQTRFETAFKHRVAGLGMAMGLRRQFIYDGVEIDRQLGTLTRRLLMLAKAESDDAPVSAEERRRRDTAVATAVRAFRAAAADLLGREPDVAAVHGELTNTFETLISKHPGTSPADIKKLRQLLDLSREWAASLASAHRNFEEFLAKTRTIVTATCVGVGQTKIRIDAKPFDWVIVDEAARCTPSELAVPIQLGRRILLVGDHRQLLPMMDRGVLKGLQEEMPDIPLAELIRSDFERAYLSSYGRDNGKTLTEQYRMSPQICNLVSRIFYEPDKVQLITSNDREADPLFAVDRPKLFARRIVWVDTSAERSHLERSAEWDDTTFWNPAEVEAVLRLLERISEDQDLVAGLAAGKEEAPIGVICMYSAQKVKIEQAFSSRPWEARFRRMVRIETVDSYQGKENTIVILTLVRCSAHREQGHVRNANRCNVAMSRAKEKLFIVGARSMWSKVGGESPMRRVLWDIDAHVDDAMTVAAGKL